MLARIRQGTGGRLRCLVCGSAALPERVARFFAAIGLPIYEGYGLTETAPVLTASGPGSLRHGTVGRPLPGVAILIGENRKFISVLIVPDFDELGAYLFAAGLPSGSAEELVPRADVVQLYQKLVDELNAGLAQFERIKRLAVLPEHARLFRGPAVMTMLRRRQAIELRWKRVVDRVYANAGKN